MIKKQYKYINISEKLILKQFLSGDKKWHIENEKFEFSGYLVIFVFFVFKKSLKIKNYYLKINSSWLYFKHMLWNFLSCFKIFYSKTFNALKVLANFKNHKNYFFFSLLLCIFKFWKWISSSFTQFLSSFSIFYFFIFISSQSFEILLLKLTFVLLYQIVQF